MKTVIVFDHPYGQSSGYNEPHHRSFTAALLVSTTKELKQAGDVVDIIDLHADQFDPVMHEADLKRWRTQPYVDEQSQQYFERLNQADRIIFLFPVWWETMPAMTTGFLDKVLAKGQITEVKHGLSTQRQLLEPHKIIRVLTVSGAPTWVYRLKYGNPIGKIFKRGVFGKMGIKQVRWHNFNAEDLSLKKRERLLQSAERYLK